MVRLAHVVGVLVVPQWSSEGPRLERSARSTQVVQSLHFVRHADVTWTRITGVRCVDCLVHLIGDGGNQLSESVAELDDVLLFRARNVLAQIDLLRILDVSVHRVAEIVEEDTDRGQSTDDDPGDDENQRRQDGEEDEDAPKS